MNLSLCCHLESHIKLIYDSLHEILVIFENQMAYTNYDILVKFYSPDGSTYCGHKYYNKFVNFDHPDGSTNWGFICYYILVKFHSPDGSTYWGLKYYIDHPDGSTIWVTNVAIF